MNINATLIVEMISFLVFVIFTMKFIWPPMTKALERRRTQISEGLAAAESGRLAMERTKKEADAIIAQARQQATAILKQAEERSHSMVEESIQRGRKEAEHILASARKDIDNQVRVARHELYNEIAGLSLKAAGQVVMAELDDEKHHKVVGEMVKAWGQS